MRIRLAGTFICLLFLCYPGICFAQEGRDWWDLLHYDIEIQPDYHRQTIAGVNRIRFEVVSPAQEMQIDLQDPMAITAVKWRGATLPFHKEGNAWFVHFPSHLSKGSRESIEVHFSGSPRAAVHPPYDNGWIWTTDLKGRPWVSVTCEGSGASIWLPCKDVLRDKPDSGAAMAITVPDSLVAVGNGRLKGRTENNDGTATWH